MKSKKVFSTLKLYRFKSVLFSTFFKIFIISMTIIILFFSYVYREASKASVRELQIQHGQMIKNIYNNTEFKLEQIDYMAARIAVDSVVSNYIASENMVTFEEKDLLEQRIVADNSMKYIESVYLYSEKKGKVFTTKGEFDYSDFDDKFWKKYYTGDRMFNNTVFLHNKNGEYPIFLTFLIKSNIGNDSGAIVVNVNILKFGNHIRDSVGKNTFICILDNDNNILYKSSKNEEYSFLVSEIIRSDGKNKENNVLKADNNSYAYEISSFDKYGIKILGISDFETYNEQMKQNLYMIFVFAPVFFIVGILFSIALAYGSFKPLSEIMELLGNSFDYNDYDSVQDDEAKFIVEKIMVLLDDNDKLRKELVEQFMKYNEVQMAALQGQIKPHFLNNTLQMINDELVLSDGNTDSASSMIVKLSRLLKYAYGYSDVMIDLTQEIKLSEEYLELLKKRYRNFEDEWEITGDISEIKIPRFILQPILENAVYHGLNQKEANGEVKINITAFENDVSVVITDNGNGMEQDIVDEILSSINDKSVIAEKVGLVNVYKRLHIAYGDKLSFNINSKKGEFTEISFSFPKQKI